MISLKGISILVVDDEKDLREILNDELSFFGATVTEAENGAQAFELLKKQRFDVLLSDIRMPVADGLQLLNNIKKGLSEKPKIFLNSGFNDITEDTAKSLGVIEIFTKPFKVDEMVESIADALALKKAA